MTVRDACPWDVRNTDSEYRCLPSEPRIGRKILYKTYDLNMQSFANFQIVLSVVDGRFWQLTIVKTTENAFKIDLSKQSKTYLGGADVRQNKRHIDEYCSSQHVSYGFCSTIWNLWGHRWQILLHIYDRWEIFLCLLIDYGLPRKYRSSSISAKKSDLRHW